MARIRTIKPEFFTSEDIVSMTPLARLFYVALWCESDREGRLDWKPRTLKMRYFPEDACDIDQVAKELLERNLVIKYEVDGRQYAEIPSFKAHQIINNRESPSTKPPRVQHASVTRESIAGPKKEQKEQQNQHASVTRESGVCDASVGEGRERKVVGRVASNHPPDTSPSATPTFAAGAPSPGTKTGNRIPENWRPSAELCSWAEGNRPDLDIGLEADCFRDYWLTKPGKDGRKLDWDLTFKNWIRSQRGRPQTPKKINGFEGGI